MRTIKFRAWDIEEKVMWLPDGNNDHEFCEVTVTDGRVCWKYGVYKPYQAMGEVCDAYSEEVFEPAPEFVMQFTGLTDKNGKEIYEGDILDDCTVVWNEHGAKFMLLTPSGTPVKLSTAVRSRVVSGNVWENPELVDA